MDFVTETEQKGFRIREDDKDFLEYSEEYSYITEFKGDNWSEGDDYLIACLDDDDKLFFIYVEYRTLTLHAYTEKGHFENGDVDIDIVRDLYNNYNITQEQIEDFTDTYIVCNDGSVIEIDTYTHVFEDRSLNFNGGANHIYYNADEGNFFVDSNKYGNDGLWEDIGEVFDYLYGNNITPNNSDIGNQVLNIDKEEYFEFGFDELSVNKINGDYKICVSVGLHDSYENEIIMDVETKDCYMVVDCPEYGEDERVYFKRIDISFNCAYVGSANGETFWVERGIVEGVLGEDFNLNDFLIQDWGKDKHWVDFGFKEIADLDDYVIACGNALLEPDDFDTNCMSEDLV